MSWALIQHYEVYEPIPMLQALKRLSLEVAHYIGYRPVESWPEWE